MLRLESYPSFLTGKGGRFYSVTENMGIEEERHLEYRQGRVGSASALQRMWEERRERTLEYKG